jgi:hypothetical protein
MKERWWGGTTVETWYKVDVRGRGTDVKESDTDYVVFDKMFKNPLIGPELDKFIDLEHIKVRASRAEQDWKKIEDDRIAKEQKAKEEQMRRELDEKLAKEKAEIDRKIREEEDKKKIGPMANLS